VGLRVGMRILIAAPPKAGNSWLKCLLAAIYDLEWLTAECVPHGTDAEEFRSWVEGGGFPDHAVFHHHYNYSESLCDVAEAHGIHIATILRDPYDIFVSRYFFTQAQADNPKRGKRDQPHDAMMGKLIDSPEALEYLAHEFAGTLEKGIAWLQSGRSVVVRYERLHTDPTSELTRATNAIQPVLPERIDLAIAACQADVLLQRRKGLQRRIRAATVGDWRNHLSDEHLAIFRAVHADRIRALGYEVQ
jgi:hypothetical protein